MKALIAVGVFAILAGIGLLVAAHTGLNFTSTTDVNTYNVVKSKAKSKIHMDVSPVPGYVAIGGGLICVGIGVLGLKKGKA